MQPSVFHMVSWQNRAGRMRCIGLYLLHLLGSVWTTGRNTGFGVTSLSFDLSLPVYQLVWPRVNSFTPLNWLLVVCGSAFKKSSGIPWWGRGIQVISWHSPIFWALPSHFGCGQRAFSLPIITQIIPQRDSIRSVLKLCSSLCCWFWS